jgi:hypothetical protein
MPQFAGLLPAAAPPPTLFVFAIVSREFDFGHPKGSRKELAEHQFCILPKHLIPNLLCSGTAGCSDVFAIELTAPQFSDLRVKPMVTVLRTPARPNVSSTSVYTWSYL